MIAELWNKSRYFYWLLVVYFTSLLSVGYIAEHFYGIAPCHLCFYQRYMMMGVAAASLLLVIFNLDFKEFKLFILMIIFCGFLISGFHIGVEQKWWAMPQACVSKVAITASDPAEILKSIKDQMQGQKIATCDKVNWYIFGIPASWLTCFAFFAAALCMAIRECLVKKS